MQNQPAASHLRFNFTVNLLDGAFFGLAIGFASFVTIIPLFVNTLTSSALLIGLIPAIHAVGWQLPQLLTANRVSRLRRFKPMVVWMTSQERLPFVGLAVLAWFVPTIGKGTALTITFLLLIWQGLGAGFAANPWLNMVAKIIPSEIRGTFLGAQSAAANLLASLSAILAGLILERLAHPTNFVLCFSLASMAMGVSWIFLALTKEHDKPPAIPSETSQSFWKDIVAILSQHAEFRSFILVRSLLAFATLAFAFYTVYAVRIHQVSNAKIGLMTGVLLGTQIAANPIMGWLGDRWGHRSVLEGGVLACIASAAIAWWAPHPDWFFLVFVLVGIGNVAVWTTGLVITLEFGGEGDRPTYIGLVNTLVAPSTILAPFLGGWVVDRFGYPATFGLSILCGIVTLLVLMIIRRK